MATNQEAIALRIERAVATHWFETCLAAPPDVIQMTGLLVQRFGSAFAVAMPLERQYPVNGANAVGLFAPATEALLDDLIAFFRAAHCGFGIGVGPLSRPDELTTWLLKRGFTKGGRTPVVYRSTAHPPGVASELRVERIGPEQAAMWKEVCQQLFVPYLATWQAALVGHAGRFHYLVFDGAMPVAVSQMSVRDGVGMLHFSGVLKAYRGRGIQRALIAQRIHDAAAAGCEWVTSTADESTPEQPGYSLHNLRTSGFDLLHYSQAYSLQP